MKKKLLYLMGILIVTAAVGAAFSYAAGTSREKSAASFQIATSFYPVYVIAENLTEGISGVEVRNMAESQTGCLHDYQMTTKDMKMLEQADVLLVNGGGMETFLDSVIKNLPDLPVVQSNTGIELLPSESGHSHGNGIGEAGEEGYAEEGHGHNHEEGNAHIWLDPVRYERQVSNLAEGLILLNPENQEQYEANRDAYVAEIRRVAEEYAAALSGGKEEDIIIFHDAFAYLQETAGVKIVHAVELEGDNSALSAGELAEVISEIRRHGIRYLFVEAQYRQTIADQVAAETGAQVIVLDSLVTGTGEKDSWLNGMRSNLEMLKECFR